MIIDQVSAIKLFLINPRLFLFTREIMKSGKTFLGYPRLLSLVNNVNKVRKRKMGALTIAEFGVGRGGSAMILAWLINRYGGTLTLFDVFGRIPPPGKRDGDYAQERFNFIEEQEDQNYYGNIPDLDSILSQEIGEIAPNNRIEFVKGKYEDNLQSMTKDYSFNIVHIDCDWYTSTKTVLKFLNHSFQLGGIIQIDDYEYWQGSQKAVDECEWLAIYNRTIIQGALIIDTSTPQRNNNS
jgi:asparagine synthase (glutamine-hydrolysing)